MADSGEATRSVTVAVYSMRGGAPPYRGYHLTDTTQVNVPLTCDAAGIRTLILTAICGATDVATLTNMATGPAGDATPGERYSSTDGQPLSADATIVAALVPMMGMD